MHSNFFLRGYALACLVASILAGAFNPDKDQYCFAACMETMSGQTFAGSPSAKEGFDAVTCENYLHVQSVFLCARAYCTEHGARIGWDYLNARCKRAGYDLRSIGTTDNVTWRDLESVRKLEFKEDPDVINTTVIPSQDFYDTSLNTISWWYDGGENHLWYSKAMFIFWGGVVGIGVIFRLARFLQDRLSATAVIHAEGQPAHQNPTAWERLWIQIRARVLVPALFDQSCNTPKWHGTLPPRLETLVIAAFVVLNIILCGVSYSVQNPNTYWEGNNTQIWRLFSDRTGILSYANIAIFFVFGIRNNILIWLTGWNFATFNRFHRWTARVATLEAVLHSVGYTVWEFAYGGSKSFSQSWADRFWWTGVIATIVISLLLGFSSVWVRVKYYDVFLVVHIASALIILVCLFYHTEIFDGEFDGFLWPCVAFWAFDRACRIGRVLYFLIGGTFSKAMVLYNKDDDVIRIDVTDVMQKRPVSGGQHFFLYSPLARLGWQSHPFTLVHWVESNQVTNRAASCSGSKNASSEKEKEQGIHGDPIEPVAISQKTQLNPPKVPEGTARYSFLVRPQKGYTRRLQQHIISKTEATPTTFLFEGPYGHVPSFHRYTDVLLIIGGSGISVGITHIYHALEQSPHARVRLVWTCRRSQSYMDSVMVKELRAAFETGRLRVNAYVTGPTSKDLIKTPSLDAVTHDRPDVADHIQRAIEGRHGALAIVACGPGSLADDVRAAFVSELKKEQRNIHLFMEAFNW